MRLVRVALGAGCLVAGLCLSLWTLGLLNDIGRHANWWWPSLPATVGAALLIRSPRRGPHVGIALALAGTTTLIYVTSAGLMTDRTWSLTGAGVLIVTGIILGAPVVRNAAGNAPPERVILILKRKRILAHSGRDYLKAVIVLGVLDLDLRPALPAGQRGDDPFTVEITAFAGRTNVTIPPDVSVLDHRAFEMRFGRRGQGAVLDEDDILDADVVLASISFFGAVDVRTRSRSDLAAPGNLLAPQRR